MQNRHRVRKSAPTRGRCPACSSDFASSARCAEIPRVTSADCRAGSSAAGFVQISRSRSRAFSSARCSSRIRNVRGSGNGKYARPACVKSANTSMLCPTSTTSRNGGLGSLAGNARTYRSACPRAFTIASSQAPVPRTGCEDFFFVMTIESKMNPAR